MKAMILAAGKGERLRPLTETTPKPLLKVHNIPLLEYHLKQLAHAGVTEVIINVWYLGEQIVSLIGNGERFGLKIQYSVEEQLLNTGGGIVKCLPMLGDEPFLVLSADIFHDFNLVTLPKNPNSLAHLVLVDNPEYHNQGDFCLEKGQVSLQGVQKLTYANIGIFRKEFFINAPSGPFPLRDLLFKHILATNVTGQYFRGSWYNIGTIADLKLVNQLVF